MLMYRASWECFFFYFLLFNDDIKVKGEALQRISWRSSTLAYLEAWFNMTGEAPYGDQLL